MPGPLGVTAYFRQPKCQKMLSSREQYGFVSPAKICLWVIVETHAPHFEATVMHVTLFWAFEGLISFSRHHVMESIAPELGHTRRSERREHHLHGLGCWHSGER